MNLEKKLNVAINFQFLFLDEQLINRSCSKWRKYQEGRTQAQKCPVGEGREEGNGLRWGSIVLVQATCYPTQVSWKQRCHLELQIGHYRDGDQGWVLSLLNRRSNIKTKKFPTFFAESREIVLALIFFRIMYIWLWVPPCVLLLWQHPLFFARFSTCLFYQGCVSDESSLCCWWSGLPLLNLFVVHLRWSIQYGISEEFLFKSRRIRMNLGGINVARFSRAFQVSKHNLEPSNSLICKL